jgi:hypothetical protein
LNHQIIGERYETSGSEHDHNKQFSE